MPAGVFGLDIDDPPRWRAFREAQGELEASGLITVHTADDGTVSYTLTAKGAQVGRSMALGGDADAVLEALLREPR